MQDGIAGDIATPWGWTPVADLAAGDLLRCLDGAPQAIVETLPADALLWLRLPVMALGNRREVILAQDQAVVLKSPRAVLPAAALIGWRGIAACPPPAQARRLRLTKAGVIMVGAGAFLACPGMDHHLPILPPDQARQLAACLIAFDAGCALRQAQAAF